MTFLEFKPLWLALRSYHVLRLVERCLAPLVVLLWPRINDARAARRASGYGVPTCLLLGGEWPFRHFAWPEHISLAVVPLELPLAVVIAGVWLAFAWAISTISRTAAIAALALYLGMRVENAICLFQDGGRMSTFELGVSALFILMLVNSARGAAAYRQLKFVSQARSGL